MAGSVLNSSSVLRLNFCTKTNICASNSATSPSCKTLAVIKTYLKFDHQQLFINKGKQVPRLQMRFISAKFLNKKKGSGKITFLKQVSINWFNGLLKIFPDFCAQYQENHIKGDVIYAKFGFVNEGFNDIKNGKDKRIEIGLPLTLHWIDCKITKTTDNIFTELKITDNLLSLSFDLFPSSELILLEGLIESNDENINANNIFTNFNTTLQCLEVREIKTKEILSDADILRRKKGTLKAVGEEVSKLLIPFILLVLLFLLFATKTDFQYYSLKEGKKEIYTAIAETNNKVVLNNIENKKSKTITIQEFQDKNNYVPFIPRQSLKTKISPYWYYIYSALALIPTFFIITYISKRKNKRIYDILKRAKNS